MLCGIVKRYCLLIVRSAFHYVSRVQADQAAPLKMRAGLQAPLGQRAELRLLSAATSPSLAREDATPLQAASDASPSLTSEDATALHAARNGLRKIIMAQPSPLSALSRAPKSWWRRSGRIRFESKRLGQGKTSAAVMSVRSW